MKKLLIGCGVLIAILLGAVAFLAYQVVPAIQETAQQFEIAAEHLKELDQSHPFSTPPESAFSPERFISALELQETLFGAVLSRIGSLGQDRGLVETVLEGNDLVQDSLSDIVEGLTARSMGPTEFSWHSSIFWVSLKRIGAGFGPAALEPYSNCYQDLDQQYEEHRAADSPSFNDNLPEVDSSISDAAIAIMATRLDLLDAITMEPELETQELSFLFMNLDEIVESGEISAAESHRFNQEQ